MAVPLPTLWTGPGHRRNSVPPMLEDGGMKPLLVTLRGFLSWRTETTIDLSNLSFAVLTGHNGAGKSSLFAAISWALYGTARTGTDKDSIVNDWENEAEVTLDFEVADGTVWRVRRNRTWQSSTSLFLWNRDAQGDWIQFNDHRIASAQKHLEQVLGMDESAFYSLVYVDQGSVSGGTRFTRAGSDERRAILMGLLPELRQWTDLEQAAVDRQYEVNSEMAGLNTVISNAREEATQTAETIAALEASSVMTVTAIHAEVTKTRKRLKQVEDLHRSATSGTQAIRDALSVHRAERVGRNAMIRSDRDLLQRRLRDGQAHLAEASQVEARIVSAEAELDRAERELVECEAAVPLAVHEFGKVVGEVDRLNKALDEAKRRYDLKTELFAATERRLNQLHHQHDEGEPGKCSLCESPLTGTKLNKLITDATAEKEAAQVEQDEARRDVTQADAARYRADSRRREAQREHEQAKQRLTEATASVSDARRSLVQLVERRDHLAGAGQPENLQELQSQIDALVDEEPSKDEQDLQRQLDEQTTAEDTDRVAEISRLNSQLDELERQGQQRSRLDGKIEAEKARLAATEQMLAAREIELEIVKVRHADVSWVRQACSQKGVPSALITDLLGAIEVRQNSILDRLMGDRAVRVEFRQERELKTRDGAVPALDIMVVTPSGYERPIESFSGGERIRITLSNLFAMVQVFNERRMGTVRTVMLDEPFGVVDQETVQIITDVLRDVVQQGIVDTVLVVSHDQDLIDAVPERLRFSKAADPEASSQVEMFA